MSAPVIGRIVFGPNGKKPRPVPNPVMTDDDELRLLKNQLKAMSAAFIGLYQATEHKKLHCLFDDYRRFYAPLYEQAKKILKQ